MDVFRVRGDSKRYWGGTTGMRKLYATSFVITRLSSG